MTIALPTMAKLPIHSSGKILKSSARDLEENQALSDIFRRFGSAGGRFGLGSPQINVAQERPPVSEGTPRPPPTGTTAQRSSRKTIRLPADI